MAKAKVVKAEEKAEVKSEGGIQPGKKLRSEPLPAPVIPDEKHPIGTNSKDE